MSQNFTCSQTGSYPSHANSVYTSGGVLPIHWHKIKLPGTGLTKQTAFTGYLGDKTIWPTGLNWRMSGSAGATAWGTADSGTVWQTVYCRNSSNA